MYCAVLLVELNIFKLKSLCLSGQKPPITPVNLNNWVIIYYQKDNQRAQDLIAVSNDKRKRTSPQFWKINLKISPI